jgi:hypothetical protein
MHLVVCISSGMRREADDATTVAEMQKPGKVASRAAVSVVVAAGGEQG